MAETVEDVPEPEVMKSGETVEGDVGGESNTSEAAAVSDISAAGDAGSVATDVSAGETAAADASVEEEKHVDDASAFVETAVVSEDDAAKEDVVSAAAADDDDDGDGVAVVMSELETDASNEVAVQPVTPGDVEEKSEPVKADTEAEINATTDRVERVTSKADKVTVSVEESSSKAGDVSEAAVPSTAVGVDAADVAKSGTTDTGTDVNKTTQDVIKMAGNDELKFGVLIGLVRVGQLSNKDVVDSVLCLVSTLCFVNVLEAIFDRYYKSTCQSSHSICKHFAFESGLLFIRIL